MKKPSRWWTMLTLKCPKCQTGKMFKPVETFGDLFEMHDNCPNCDLKFEIEIGFFWGAMYAAYGISSALCFIAFVLAFWGFGWNEYKAFIFLTIIVLLAMPYTFRLSRAIWLYAFIK